MAIVIYEQVLETQEVYAKQWRDAELTRTDIAATVSDYPNAEAILVYREALRQWPATNEAGEYINGFPATRPEL